MDKLFFKTLFFAILVMLLICVYGITAEGAEFGRWQGHGTDQKTLVGYSHSKKVQLMIWIDDDQIFRLKFSPERKIRLATFDDKRIRGMTFTSLYGYDHWIKRMIRHRHLRIWFENDKNYEYFSLKGFSKGVQWLY